MRSTTSLLYLFMIVLIAADDGARASSTAPQPVPYLSRHCAQVAPPGDQAKRTADVQRLMAKMSTGSEEERSQVADDLACYGPSADAAIPLMIQLFAARMGEIQANGVSAVTYIGEPAVPHLIEALADEDLRIRQNACRALGGIGPAAKAALPALAALAVSAADTAANADIAMRKIVCGASQ